MTMPHLMNCAHSSSGWCLPCVKDLHDKGEKAYQDYLSLLPVTYAAEELADGRIQLKAFFATVHNARLEGCRGLEKMSRLLWLESENQSLHGEVAYLKAAMDRVETKEPRQ